MNVHKLNESYAAARKIIAERLDFVLADDFIIGNGANASYFNEEHNKKLCIMEATAFVLGYTNISDEPPCTSVQIRSELITANDYIQGDDRRKKLTDIIPDIINTAPTKWVEQFGSFGSTWVLVQDSSAQEYRAAEVERQRMLRSFRNEHGPTEDWVNNDATLTKFLKLIREAALLAKFEGAGQDPDVQEIVVGEA